MQGSEKVTIELAKANFLAKKIIANCNGCESFGLFLNDEDEKGVPLFSFVCVQVKDSTTKVTELDGENYPCGGRKH